MRYNPPPQIVENNGGFFTALKNSVFDLWFNADKLTETHISDVLTTTDTSIQTLQLIPLEKNTAYHIHTVITGVESTDRATYELIGTFYRGAGSAAQEGATSVLHSVESDSSWSAVFDINDNDVRIRISGIAAWRCNTKLTPLRG